MKHILVVHQSADLYGSDRVLLALMASLNRNKYYPIVLLPVDGPLIAEMAAAGVECHVLPIARVSRATLSLRGLLRLPVILIRSIRAINRVLNERHVDIVHSNTLAVLSGALWARWYRVPHVWHVHEIILTPTIVRKVYALLLCRFADCVICVSNAVKENLLQDKPALGSKIQVVWNGLARDLCMDVDEVRQCRHSMGVRDGDVLVALVGRINRWKGHDELVKAAGILWQQGVCHVRFVIAGSVVPGQEHFLNALQLAISGSPAKQCFILLPFTKNIWLTWDACDIAVIPSIEPEPFGMVALEAMLSSKPVIAANHGGLSEIIVNEETGLLVEPRDSQALAAAILRLVQNESERARYGICGKKRAQEIFSLDKQLASVCKIYELLCTNQP